VRQEFNLTDEGMARVHKKIQEAHEKDGYVLSPRAAAALIVHDTPPKPLEPTGYSGGWDMFAGDTEAEKANLKSLIDDPDAWLHREVDKIHREFVGQNRLPIGV
jgi:hypothetical protein